MANISITGGTLVVEKERQEVVETIAAVNESNVSVKRGTLVMKSMEQIARESVPESTATQSLAEPFRQPIAQEGESLRPQVKPERPEVEVTELPDTTAASGVQPTDGKDPTQDLLDRIAFGEGADPAKLKAQEKHGIGTTQYDMVYNYGDTLAPSKPVSEMTMEELYDFQTDLINATKGTVPGTNLGTSAVGKYQVIRKSLFGSGTADKPAKNSWADKLNLKADTVYTPELQEKIAMLALKEAGYESFIRGDKTEKAFHDRIANIWASVAKASGKDTYGQGVHTLKADLEPMYELLKPVKTENTNRDTSPRPMLRPDEEEE